MIADLQKWLGIESFSIPLLLFFIGLGINAYISYSKRKTHRTLIRLNHLLLIKEMSKQSKYYENFRNQMDIERSGSFEILFRIIRSLSVFSEFGYESVFKAYFSGIENLQFFGKKEKIKAFDEFWKNVEYVKDTYPRSLDRSESLVEKNAQLNELRNASLSKVQVIIEDFRLKFTGQLELREPLGEFYDKRERIIANWNRSDNHLLAHNVHKYVNNLLNLNREDVSLMRRYKSDIKSVELNSYLLESCYRFDSIKNLFESYHASFDHLAKEYYKGSVGLIKAYRNLNPNSKRTWRIIKCTQNFMRHSLRNKIMSVG